MNRWYELAEKEAEKSEYPRINIGAVLVVGNYLVGKGFNQKKSHPMQAEYNGTYKDWDSNHYLHAEIHSLIQSGRESVKGGDCYVFRKDRNGTLADSRPCISCWNALKDAGIERVYYTTPSGYCYEEVNPNDD